MDGDLETTIRKILSYLVDYPGAQDTLEGIAEWWILDRDVEVRLSEVREALAVLVERRLVIEVAGAGSPARYRVDAERLPEIRRLLAEAGER